MKKSDIAMIILIASVCILAAYFGARLLIGDVANESVTVKTIEPISSDVTQPDPSVFRDGAINPTVEIIIGDTAADQAAQ